MIDRLMWLFRIRTVIALVAGGWVLWTAHHKHPEYSPEQLVISGSLGFFGALVVLGWATKWLNGKGN